jgi:Uma2 family endonuclease
MVPIRQKAVQGIDVVSEDASLEIYPTELGPMSVSDYLSGPESNEWQELRHGWYVREGFASTTHQLVEADIHAALRSHVLDRHLGVVMGSVDVVLDEERRLVVGPDLLVILNERSYIMREGRVWGAPNLTVEILSPSNRGHDRVRKLAWYRDYGVQEYWIVDPGELTVEVFDLEAEPPDTPRMHGEADLLESRVIPGFRHPVAKFFEHVFSYFGEKQLFPQTDGPKISTLDANADGTVGYDTERT